MKEIRISGITFMVLALIVVLFVWSIGYFSGVRATKGGWGAKLEKSQVQLRLDLKKLSQKAVLAKIIDSLFKERNRIIDWNKEHIILTVEPLPKVEGN